MDNDAVLITTVVAAVLGATLVGAVQLSSFTPVSGVTPVGVQNGPMVEVDGASEINLTAPQQGPHTVFIQTPSGNATFVAGASATVHVDVGELTGPWTNVSQLAVSGTSLKIDPADKRAFNASGDVDRLSVPDSFGLDDGTADFVYGGNSGTSTVTIRGVPADTGIAAVDKSSGDVLDGSRSTASGTVTFSGLPNSDHVVLLQTGGDGPDLSDGAPQGDLSTEPQNLSVELSDRDMPNDEVNVSFYVDGTFVGGKTVTSNGEVQVDVSSTSFMAGLHDVRVESTDAYGNTDTLTYQFGVPDTLYVRNSTNASQLVDNATVDVTFYSGTGTQTQVVTRTTTDGTINLSGLPADKPIVATATADGYRDRRIFIKNLYEQQTIYLLDKDFKFVKTIFKLQDYSGRFPQDTTVLQVSRSINGSYKTVLGDFFQVDGEFTAQLKYGERHQLRLLNTATGATKELGTYTPLASGTQTLSLSTAGTVDVLTANGQFLVQPNAELLPAQSVTMDFRLRNGSETIDTYKLRVYRIANGNNVTVVNVTRDEAGTITRTINLSTAGNGSLKVVQTYIAASGAEKRRTRVFGIKNISDGGANTALLPGLADLTGQLPRQDRGPFTTALGIVVTLTGTAAAGSRFRLSSEMLGAVALLLLTSVAVIGWVGYDLLFVGIVAWGSLTIARRAI